MGLKFIRYSLRSPFSISSIAIMTFRTIQITVKHINQCCGHHCTVQTHWLPQSDHSIKRYHIGMGKLAHNSCLLEELHSVTIRSTWLQQLYGHLHLSLGTLPEPSADCSKVARAQVLHDSVWSNNPCHYCVVQCWINSFENRHYESLPTLMTILVCNYPFMCLVPSPTGHIGSLYPPYLMPLNLPKPVLGQLLIEVSSIGSWHPVDVTLCEKALLLILHTTAVPNNLRRFCTQ